MRNDPCWCGSGKKWKKCHFPHKPSETFITTAEIYLKKYGIILKTAEEIKRIRKACKLAASILKKVCEYAKEGVTTNELDHLAVKLHKEANAIPAPLHYGNPPYPKAICTSLNEVICHGIPNDIPLKKGDILNIDISCQLNGAFGDCSSMVAIQPIDEEKEKVMDVSYECLLRGIAVCKPNVPLLTIGQAIEDFAVTQGCSVVNQFVGHGIGLKFHEPPEVCHHYNKIDILMVPGMTFTIEPMINAGVREGVIDPKNQWEARTKDLKASAQWEHTILITDFGHEILTLE